MQSKLSVGLLIGALGLTACAFEPAGTMDGLLVDMVGRTLYVFDKDTPGKSNCIGACATAWPPLGAAAGAEAMGELNVIARDDGSRQWAYLDKPLYHYAGDKRPGDINGENSGGVWHTMRSTMASNSASLARPHSNAATGNSYAY